MARFDSADIRAALIVGSVAAAAGLARWYMDGSQADAAKLVSGLRHPLDRLHSLGGLVVAGTVVAFSYCVWWLLLGRRGRTRTSAKAPRDRTDTPPG